MKLKETINLITEAGLANWDEKCPPGGGVIPYNRLMGMCSQMGSHFHSLRSKRFQLSHCAKVRAGAFLFFFVLVPTFSTNSRGNACYAG